MNEIQASALIHELELMRGEITHLREAIRTQTFQSGWVCKECGHSLDYGAIICPCGKTDPKLVRR